MRERSLVRDLVRRVGAMGLKLRERSRRFGEEEVGSVWERGKGREGEDETRRDDETKKKGKERTHLTTLVYGPSLNSNPNTALKSHPSSLL